MKFLLALLLVVGCSKAPEIEKKNSVEILFLVAPWCAPCRHELSQVGEVSKRYDMTRISVGAVSETGKNSNSQPTQESADELKSETGFPFVLKPDTRAWALQKQYFEGAKFLPSAVIFSEGQPLKTFAPKYEVEEVFAAAKGFLK